MTIFTFRAFLLLVAIGGTNLWFASDRSFRIEHIDGKILKKGRELIVPAPIFD